MRNYERLCGLESGFITLGIFTRLLPLLFEEFASDALLGILHVRDALQFPSDVLP